MHIGCVFALCFYPIYELNHYIFYRKCTILWNFVHATYKFTVNIDAVSTIYFADMQLRNSGLEENPT